MTDSDKEQRRAIRRFSPDTQRALLETLKDKRICGEIECRCLHTATIPEIRSDGEIKADLVNVHRAVRNLIKAVEATGWEAGLQLRMQGAESEDEKIRELEIRVLPENDQDALEEMFDQIGVVERLLVETIAKFQLRRGRKRKSAPLFLALEVLEVFHENDMRATSYQDGLFFRTLELVLKELLPNLGDEAYRRYGENVLRQWPRYSQWKRPKT